MSAFSCQTPTPPSSLSSRQQSLAASPRHPSLPSRRGVQHPPLLRPRLHPAHRPSCPPLLSRHKAGGVLHRRPLPRQHRSQHQKRRHPSLRAMYRTPPWTHPPSPKHQSTPSLRQCSRRPARGGGASRNKEWRHDHRPPNRRSVDGRERHRRDQARRPARHKIDRTQYAYTRDLCRLSVQRLGEAHDADGKA